MFRRHASFAVLIATPSIFAQVVTYEGDSFPEEVGWERHDFINLADRWLKDGWLVQAPIVLPCPPDCTTQDYYRWELKEQSGFPAWFLSWVVTTDAPAAFGAVAPASIVAGGTSGIRYHFVIGDDQLSFLRGSQFPIVFVDLEPGVHHFRVELRNEGPTGTYAFMIDGSVIDEGEAEGFYPTDDSRITFGARAAVEDNLTRWDAVRFGLIPKTPGDFDSDGDIDLRDYKYFAECAENSGAGVDAGPGCVWADMDGDNDVDLRDFGLFQAAYTGS